MIGQSSLTVALALASQLVSVNAAASSGCGTAYNSSLIRGGVGSSNRLSFTTSTGAVRSYLLHIPSAYDINTPAPLAFNFHGRSSDSAYQEGQSQMSDENWNKKYLVVYPDGINQQWQGDPDATGYDDVGFVLELVASLKSKFCLDSSRIYASGLSNGGGLSANVLACDPVASTIFAAFAGMSGAYYQGTTDANCDGWAVSTAACNPGRSPVPLFTTHGDADGTINYLGGPRRGRCLPAIPHFMTDWATRNNLGSSNISTSLYNNAVTKYEYGTGPLQGVDTHYMITGWGHYWPSIAGGAPFDATVAALAFFDKWTLDSTPVTPRNTTVASSSTASSAAITTAAAATATTASSPSASTKLSCPASNGQTFLSTNGTTFLVECDTDRGGGDMGMAWTTSFEGCINTCGVTPGCVDVSLSGSACYLKSAINSATTRGGIWGAKAVSSGSSLSSSSSSSSSAAASTLATSTKTSTSTAPSTAAFTLTSTSAAASSSSSYTYYFSSDSSQGSYSNARATKDYTDCATICDATASCSAFTYVGGANGVGSGTCWLKTKLGSAVSVGQNNYVSGVRATSSSSSSVAASTSNASSSSSTSTAAVTAAASNTVTSTSTSTSAAATSSSTGNIVCPAANGTTYTDASGSTFSVTCVRDAVNNNIGSSSTQSSFGACSALCAKTSGCTSVTFSASSGSCSLRSAGDWLVNAVKSS